MFFFFLGTSTLATNVDMFEVNSNIRCVLLLVPFLFQKGGNLACGKHDLNNHIWQVLPERHLERKSYSFYTETRLNFCFSCWPFSH